MKWFDGMDKDFSGYTAEQLIQKICDEQFDYDYEDRLKCGEPVRTLSLLAAFDTEMSVEGIYSCLENSIGHYFPQIIEALRTVGDKDSADALEKICAIASPDKIRAEFIDGAGGEYEVSSFSEDHSLSADECDAIDELDEMIYINNGFDMWALAEEYAASMLREISQ